MKEKLYKVIFYLPLNGDSDPNAIYNMEMHLKLVPRIGEFVTISGDLGEDLTVEKTGIVERVEHRCVLKSGNVDDEYTYVFLK